MYIIYTLIFWYAENKDYNCDQYDGDKALLFETSLAMIS